tara:strand:+ start:599 stop:793 length:195 start_codon:yes stop_codon:yes gene_type:complete
MLCPGKNTAGQPPANQATLLAEIRWLGAIYPLPLTPLGPDHGWQKLTTRRPSTKKYGYELGSGL